MNNQIANLSEASLRKGEAAEEKMEFFSLFLHVSDGMVLTFSSALPFRRSSPRGTRPFPFFYRPGATQSPRERLLSFEPLTCSPGSDSFRDLLSREGPPDSPSLPEANVTGINPIP